MAKEFSPEEKLLNLIKKRKGDQAPAPAKPERDQPGPAIPQEDAAQQQEREGRVPPALFTLGNIAKLEHIRVVNTVLFAMLVVILLYFFVDILLIPPKVVTISEDKEGRAPRKVEKIKIEPYKYYSRSLANKEVFKPLVREEAVSTEPVVPPEEIIGNLTLQGIVSGATPQAIIEDKKMRRSFFLKEGQSTGGVLLKKIEDGSVTVVYKGEEFSLSL